jgi:hypothetical protein
MADPGTRLSEINISGTLDIEFGKNGRTYIRVGKYGNKIQVFPEKTSPELAQNVAKLLADTKVNTPTKFSILEKIYNINDDNFNVTYDNTKKKPVMVIYSGKDEVYNSENPELTDEGFIKDVLAGVYINISKENLNGSIQLPDYTSGKLVKRNTLYNDFITRNSKVFVALRNDGSIKFFNPSLQYEFTVEALEQMYPTEKKDEPVVEEETKEAKPKAKAKPKTVVKNQNVNTTPSGFKGELDMDLIDEINKSLKRAGFETVNSTPEQIEEIKVIYFNSCKGSLCFN